MEVLNGGEKLFHHMHQSGKGLNVNLEQMGATTTRARMKTVAHIWGRGSLQAPRGSGLNKGPGPAIKA